MYPRLTQQAYGVAPDGRAVDLYTLEVGSARVRVATYGGHLTEIAISDRTGVAADVALGYDDLAGYVADTAYFGALVGRYANRIADGRFTLDGREYTLATNNGPNALHGGMRGFNRVVWAAEPFETASAAGVVLRHTSPDGDEGYPGTLDVRVTYTLSGDVVFGGHALAIDYEATSDAATPINFTQHTYWNLAGHAAGPVLDHALTLAAARYTPVDAALIPTGDVLAVGGTPFDFRAPHTIGARIGDDDAQLAIGMGYDHNYVLDGEGRDGEALGGDRIGGDRTAADRLAAGMMGEVAAGALAFAARVSEPTSGRVLEVHTTEPGVQFYSGNMIPEGLAGKQGARYGPRGGFALETQHYPDSPNQPRFPSTILRPGTTFRSRTVFRFLTDAEE